MKLFEIPMVITFLVGLGFLAGPDAPPARADFTFGESINCAIPNVNLDTDCPDCFSLDGLEMYISSFRSGGQGADDLCVCKRASPEDGWGPPENLGPMVNSAGADLKASITADGLELYFLSTRPGGYGGMDLYVTRRTARNSPWGQPTNLGSTVNGTYDEGSPCVSSDGLELYVDSDRSAGYGDWDLYVSKRATREDPWGDPVNLGPAVNGPASDCQPCLSPDGLLLFFVSNRPGGYGDYDLWMTRRASRSAPWEPRVNLGPKINGPLGEVFPLRAPDGSALYFQRISGSTSTYLKAPTLPIVDFNGDGKVDGREVIALADHLGQNKSLYDIGLTPMGDGVVDANDLKVLAGYIGQEVNDPTLIAHWALDETQGTTAADSVAGNDLTVIGNATWQPDGGKIGGALQLDGKSSFASSAKSVLDPSAGPFSVIAWVKGGAQGQVIVSQSAGADWLYLDQNGMLATDLMSSDRKKSKSLTSHASVVDDQWHRVVLTWDGTNRALYVEDVEVAKDTQPSLAASSGSLNIGAGKTLNPATFWSGLIDDVRIYNRVVQP